ncbi:dienelactone hydrolase family protein [Pseudomonas sp. Marseille-QA0892]
MMIKRLLPLLLAGSAGLTHAATINEEVAYEIDGKPYQGVLVYDDSIETPRPGLLMVPNWMGVSEAAVKKATEIASDRYVVFVADLYGRDIRPKNADEAKAAATTVRSDRSMMRLRANEAVEVFGQEARKHGLPMQGMAAIGFCFGGGTILELARSGAPLKAFVSFHGNLDTPTPDDAKQVKAPILVLHGADDPSVPPAQVDAFVKEMQAAKTDWQLVSYGGAVHSFTDPDANVPGRNQYHPVVAARAFREMNNLMDDVFDN